jgi:ATP-dependent Clp protease ATP-binding subunit ClpA
LATFSRTLENTLRRALSFANDHRHEYVTLEHLLLSLIDDDDAAQVMSACKVDLDKLRFNLDAYLENELDSLVVTDRDQEEPRPTAGFQRVLQRAMLHVDSSGGREVTGANVLVALFSERESHAAYFLQEQDMTRYDAVNFISHGLPKRAGAEDLLLALAQSRQRYSRVLAGAAERHQPALRPKRLDRRSEGGAA